MTDRHLVEMREITEEGQVSQIEIVPGVDPEAKFVGPRRGARVARERLGRRLSPGAERTSKWLGIQLDPVRA